MPRDQETQRRLWREKYARMYPPGFKRRRNAEQTALQRASQRRYQSQSRVLLVRRLQRQVREYLAGTSKIAANMVGCTQAQLKEHLEATLTGAPVLQWCLAYHKHPREFNLNQEEDQRACFHYSNMYARPIRVEGTFRSPSQQAQSQAASSHAVLSYQA